MDNFDWAFEPPPMMIPKHEQIPMSEGYSYNNRPVFSNGLKIVGRDSGQYNRHLQVVNKVDSKILQAKKLKTVLIKHCGKLYPHTIYDDAVELYLSTGLLRRNRARRGLLAVCLYRVGAKSGIAKTHKELAKLLDTPNNYVSVAEKYLLILEASRCPKICFIEKFLYLCGIGLLHKPEIENILNKLSDPELVNGVDNSKPSTRTIGAIYYYANDILKMGLTKSKFATMLKVGRNGFSGFYLFILQNKHLIE